MYLSTATYATTSSTYSTRYAAKVSAICGARRGGGDLGGAHEALHDEGLAADLGDVPAGQCRDPAGKAHRGKSPQQRARQALGVPGAPAQHPPAVQLNSSISTPVPTIKRKPKNTGATGGCASLNVVQPDDLGIRVVLEDEARGARNAERVAIAARRPRRARRTAAAVRRARSATRPPSRRSSAAGARACSGHAGRRRRSAAAPAPRRAPVPLRSAFGVDAFATPLMSCHALKPAIRNDTVRPDASSMCVSRYGNDGLNSTSSHERTWNTPSASMVWPVGVCIHELRLRIQNALTVVPNATRRSRAGARAR